MKIRITLVVAFALLLSACAAPSTSRPVENVLPTSETLPTPESTQPSIQAKPSPTGGNMAEIAAYTDNVAGFSIDYPANWFIDASAATNADQAFAYSVGIATWDLRNPQPSSGKGQNGIPEGGTKIDVAVMKQPMTLEKAVAQQAENESGSPILAGKDVTLANGLPAVILDVEGFAGPIRTLLVSLNGNVIYVSGYGNLEHFESIALTLRAK